MLRRETRYNKESAGPQGFWVLDCNRCGSEGLVPAKGMKNTRDGGDERYVAGKLRDAGWDVGNNLKKPICAECVRKDEKRRADARATRPVLTVVQPEPSMTSVVNQSTPAPITQDVRAPSPAQRRVILAKLDDHYDLDHQRYRPGFSDQRLGRDLNFPHKWVADLREQIYGPALPPEIAAIIPDIERLDDRLKEAEQKAQRVHDEIATIKKDLAALHAKVNSVGRAA